MGNKTKLFLAKKRKRKNVASMEKARAKSASMRRNKATAVTQALSNSDASIQSPTTTLNNANIPLAEMLDEHGDESAQNDTNENLPDHMNLDTLELINEIMIRPEIWMSKHPANKNKWKTLRKWEDMKNSKFPVFTVDDLKKRWKNIKDQYRKELKKIPPGRGGDATVSSWKYFDYMKFLKDELAVYKDKEAEPETADIDVLADCSGSQDFRMSDVSEIKSEFIESPQHSDQKSDEEAEPTALPTRPRTYQPPKEMREELLKIEQRKLQILEAEVAKAADFMKSDNYQFLMSILPEMEKLPSVYKMRLRTKISQAVLDEVTSYDSSKYNNLDPIQVAVKEEPINMYD